MTEKRRAGNSPQKGKDKKTKGDAERLRVGIIGATGMVGQRFIILLTEHPIFEITVVAASAGSSGKTYAESVEGRWAMPTGIPDAVALLMVKDAANVGEIAKEVDFIFSAISLDKAATLALEEEYAKAEVPVVSNNSASRDKADVPMIIPEINYEHTAVIETQRKRLGTKRGFIAVKPNCSIQSYVPALHPLVGYGIKHVVVSTYQAISGAGKTFETWPEMVGNVIPFISGEEPKSENEPKKIWGQIVNGVVKDCEEIPISAQCIRVAVLDGHLATVFLSFKEGCKPSIQQIKEKWAKFSGPPQEQKFPSAPTQFITYFEQEDRPQSLLDRDVGNGMGVAVGRLREDDSKVFDYKFVCLSHNTVRGAAGGAVLMAELLHSQGYLTKAN